MRWYDDIYNYKTSKYSKTESHYYFENKKSRFPEGIANLKLVNPETKNIINDTSLKENQYRIITGAEFNYRIMNKKKPEVEEEKKEDPIQEKEKNSGTYKNPGSEKEKEKEEEEEEEEENIPQQSNKKKKMKKMNNQDNLFEILSPSLENLKENIIKNLFLPHQTEYYIEKSLNTPETEDDSPFFFDKNYHMAKINEFNSKKKKLCVYIKNILEEIIEKFFDLALLENSNNYLCDYLRCCKTIQDPSSKNTDVFVSVSSNSSIHSYKYTILYSAFNAPINQNLYTKEICDKLKLEDGGIRFIFSLLQKSNPNYELSHFNKETKEKIFKIIRSHAQFYCYDNSKEYCNYEFILSVLSRILFALDGSYTKQFQKYPELEKINKDLNEFITKNSHIKRFFEEKISELNNLLNNISFLDIQIDHSINYLFTKCKTSKKCPSGGILNHCLSCWIKDYLKLKLKQNNK
jgi:hypothetical protein